MSVFKNQIAISYLSRSIERPIWPYKKAAFYENFELSQEKDLKSKI